MIARNVRMTDGYLRLGKACAGNLARALAIDCRSGMNQVSEIFVMTRQSGSRPSCDVQCREPGAVGPCGQLVLMACRFPPGDSSDPAPSCELLVITSS